MGATRQQVAFLERLKLPVPTDCLTASRLLDFALHGNDSCEKEAKERRTLIREYWDRWVGKPVQIIHGNHRFRKQFGRVENLKARTTEEVSDIIAAHSAIKPLPFIAVVRIEPANSNTFVEVNLTSLKRVPVIQGRLFSP